MNRRELALAFVRHFAAADLAQLRRLLHPNLNFRGPLVQTDTADDYLASLDDGSLQPAEARILHVGVDSASVSVFYEYVKPSGALTIAQLFRFRDGRIAETIVVFNTQELA